MRFPARLFSLLLTLLLSKTAFGSHSMGSDLTYQCLGGNSYEITLSFYRDCAGIDADTGAFIVFQSSCFPADSVEIFQIPGTGRSVRPARRRRRLATAVRSPASRNTSTAASSPCPVRVPTGTSATTSVAAMPPSPTSRIRRTRRCTSTRRSTTPTACATTRRCFPISRCRSSASDSSSASTTARTIRKATRSCIN